MGARDAQTRRVIPTYPDDPLAPTKALLINWGRWTRQGVGPGIGYPPAAAWARGWIPAMAWDFGWGDRSPPADAVPVDPNIGEAKRIDAALLILRARCLRHFVCLKRHYSGDWRQERDQLDAAVRGLADLL